MVVPIWMFYALRDRHNFERNFAAALPAPVQPDVLNGVRIADRLVGRYLRGQLLLGFIVGVATFIGLVLLDVELAIALAESAGIAELIPIIGPFIGALPAIVIVLATDPDKIIWVLLLLRAGAAGGEPPAGAARAGPRRRAASGRDHHAARDRGHGLRVRRAGRSSSRWWRCSANCSGTPTTA